MATRLERIQRSLMGRQAAHRLAMAMRGDVQKRVVHCLISDSNGQHTDYGFLGGLGTALAARFPCFGTGFYGAKHARLKYTRGGGTAFAFPKYGEAVAPGGSGVRLSISVDNASWNNGTLTLTLAGAFTNYSYRAGDFISIYSVTSGTTGDYAIASKTSANAIVLATSIGASASAVYGYVESIKGGSSNTAVPAAFAQGWNMPRSVLPLGSTMVYVPTTAATSMSSIHVHKNCAPLPMQGRLTHNAYGMKGTSGSFTVELYDSDGASTHTQLVAATTSANGTAGDWVVGRATTSRGDRTGNAREFIWASVAASAGAPSNQGAMAHLGSSVTNADMPYGVCVQGFAMRGGWSAYDHANLFQNILDNNTIDNYLRITRDQWSAGAGGSGSGIANFIFYLGFNDHAETGTSLGPAAVSNSTAAGYIDNIQAVINVITARWEALFGAGTAASECCFTIIPSHPISDSPTTPGVGDNAAREGLTQTYRRAAFGWAAGAPNRIAIDLFTLLGTNPYTRLNGQGLTLVYDTDVIHLNHAGFNLLGSLVGEVIDTAGDASVLIGGNRLLVGSLGGG